MTDPKLLASVKKMRQMFLKSDTERDRGLPTEVPGVRRFDDLSYGPDPKWHLLDIYEPSTVTKKLPVVINIHGGGYCYGTKETYQFYGLWWAKQGFAFVNPNYRLAPDVVFPAQLDDVNRYIHWVVDHADQYHLDLTNVFIVGDSAGGQMGEQYLAILTNEEYRQKFGYQLPQLTVRVAALNSGAFFIDDFLKQDEDQAPVAYMTPEIQRDHLDMLQAEAYINSNFPPVYLTTANQDFVRNLTFKLDGFLIAKGVTHITKMYGDHDHPRKHVFLINQRDDIAMQANRDELAFFKQYLR